MQNFGPHARLFEQHALAYAGEQRFGPRPTRRPDRHMPHRAASQLIDHHDESADLIEHLPAVSIRRAAHGIRQTLFGLRPERRAVPSSLELRWQETLLQVARERKAPPFRFSPKLRQLGVRYIDGQLWLHPFPPLPSRSVGACAFAPLSSLPKFIKRFPTRPPFPFAPPFFPS